MTAITGHHADLDGIRLHYLRAGREGAEPLVLLHGVPQTSHAWRHLIPHLGDRFDILAPDRRGLGDSARPEGGYDKRTVAEDVRGGLIPGCGHWVAEEAPEYLAAQLLAFFGEPP